MGLTNWIKDKYYNHKLSLANKHRGRGNYAKAEKTFNSIVGKHPDAYLQLAEMLTKNSKGYDSLLRVLTRLKELRSYDNGSVEFAKSLEEHVKNVESFALTSFQKGLYKDAIELQKSIQDFRLSQAYKDTLNRYLAFEAFDAEKGFIDNRENLYHKTSTYLNQISIFPKNDIDELAKKLIKEKKYLRSIIFLSKINDRQPWIKDEINKSILEAVLDNDSEIKRLKSFKDISSDKVITKEGSLYLYHKAKEYAKKKEFKKAVHLVNFASEILSDNKDFNLDRCKFILEEFRPRINSKEVKGLMSLSKKLKLDDQQTSQLKKRINEISVDLSPKESIEISRIFIGESIFDKLYLERALTLAKKGESLDLTELHQIINNLTDELTLPNVLGSFTPYIPSFKDEFIESAIKAIKKEDSVELLNRYWEILPDIKFIVSLVSNENASWEKYAQNIETNHGKYFTVSKVSLELIKQFIRQSNNAKDTIEKRNWGLRVLEVADISKSYRIPHGQQERVLSILQSLIKNAQEHYLSDLPEHIGSAELILEKIESYPEYWIQLKSWLRNQSAIKEEYPEVLSRDAKTLKDIIAKYNNCKSFSDEEFVNLWKRYIENRFDEIKDSSHEKAIKLLTNLLKACSSYAPEFIYNEYKDAILKSLVKQKWELAVEKEKDQEFKEAISLYDQIVAHGLQSYNNRAEIRSLICHVKFNDFDDSISQRIQEAIKLKSYQALREDLIYRYVCWLIEQVRPDEAETLIKEYLTDEYELLVICEKLGIKQAELKLEEFNENLKKINTLKMSVEEAKSFLANINNYKKSIIGRLPDLSRSFANYKKQIESYILWKMFEEEDFLNIIQKLMSDNPNYIEDDTVFRNIAIASLGLIESDEKDETQLKRAISLILSAIYTDRLFVKSLEYTSWDDKYTFTLEKSLGLTLPVLQSCLPFNVNYDAALEGKNIAIRDVQMVLLLNLETIIRKKHPELEDFFISERDTLNRIFKIGCADAFIPASPFLAKTLPSIRMSIKNSLDGGLDIPFLDHEEIFSVGVEYGFRDGEYGEYANAYNALLFCKNSLESKSAVQSTSTFTPDRISSIKRYSRLWAELKSALSNSINADIRKGLDYKLFLSKYEQPVKAINDINLSLTSSDYLNKSVIRLLNEDLMSLREGIGYIVKIYNLAPSNIQVKQNVIGILNNLAHQSEKNNSTADRNALKKALVDLNGQFDDEVELSLIIAQLTNKKIELYSALSRTYNLYTKRKNDAEVCDSLVALIKLSIHKYIIGNTYNGKTQVKTVLNQLQNNRSSTFKDKARMLAKEYLDIFKQLPSETQILIMGGFSYGQSLNANGIALKEGLNYLQNLSDLDQLLKKH